MEQSVDLGRLIGAANRSNFKEPIEKGPDPSFSRKFSQELEQFIVLSSNDIPQVSPVVPVEREGSFGILPSPARIAVAKAMLTGERIPPLKLHEETIHVGEPERLLDNVYLHAIVEIDPRTAVNKAEQEAIINTLLSIWQTVLLDKPTFKGVDQAGTPVSIKTAEIQAVLHLIKKGAVGNYKYDELPIVLQSDVQNALSSVEQGLSWVLQFHPNDTPKSDHLVGEILDAQIKKAVGEDNGEKKISLPIFVMSNHIHFIPTINPLLLVRPGNNLHMQLLNR